MKYWFGCGWLLGMAAGVALGVAGMGLLPHAPLAAVATNDSEGFTIATGYVDDGTEGIFTLDHLTGELKAYVYNAAARGFTPQGIYSKTITEDLKLEAGKQPKFLMVTGAAEMRGAGQTTFAPTLVYVAELNSGNMAVYGMSASRNTAPTFVLVYSGAIRAPQRTP
jgi:hypothetical protein